MNHTVVRKSQIRMFPFSSWSFLDFLDLPGKSFESSVFWVFIHKEIKIIFLLHIVFLWRNNSRIFLIELSFFSLMFLAKSVNLFLTEVYLLVSNLISLLGYRFLHHSHFFLMITSRNFTPSSTKDSAQLTASFLFDFIY